MTKYDQSGLNEFGYYDRSFNQWSLVKRIQNGDDDSPNRESQNQVILDIFTKIII